MVSKEILRQVVVQQKEGMPSAEGMVEREILKDVKDALPDSRILIATGLRRSGKSTLLRQVMEGISGWCYVSFEDERLLDFRAQDFELLNEALVEAYGECATYFFDEIQNVENFEAFVRRLQDQGKKVIMTGSNAHLLSSEFGTKLTGRYKPFVVYPFSFREYLAFRGVPAGKDRHAMTDGKVRLLKHFADYSKDGGLPEYLRNGDIEYVRTLYENILYRDIIARYSIRSQKTLKELVNILATNVSSPFTYNALRKDLGLSNAITVKEYVSYLGNSYLFFELPRFDYSVKKQLAYPKKIYIVDPAFGRIGGFRFSPDAGKSLENLVFTELKRKGMELYYYSGKKECDFVAREGTKVVQAIQVCHSLEKDNEAREKEGLLEAMEKFGLKEGMIITHDQEEDSSAGGKRIKIVPAWKWLLGI